MNILVGDLFPKATASLDPRAFPDELFELWSIPAYDNGEPETVPGKEIGSAKKCVLPGDVLLSRIVPHIRRSWIVESQNGHRQIASGEWIILRSSEVLPAYLRLFLLSDRFHTQFLRTVAGVGGSLLRARPSEVAKIKVPVPSLSEQERIAAIFQHVESAIRKARFSLNLTNQLAASLFASACHGSTNHIPFDEAAYFQEGPGIRNWQFRSSGIKLINVKNIVDGDLNTSNTSRFLDPDEVQRKYAHFLLDPGDLVMASSGVTWGKVAEVSASDLPLCLNTSMIRVRPLSKRFTTSFLRGFIEYGTFRAQINRLITGSAQPNFGPSHLRKVLVPDIDGRAHEKLDRTMSVVQSTQAELRTQLSQWNALGRSLDNRFFGSQSIGKM